MKFQNFKFLFLIGIGVSLNAYTMIRALNTAATGMSAQETNVNTISNNIANVNTVGFKKGRTEFEDLHYQTIQEAGARSSANTQFAVGTQIGSGAKVSAVRKNFEQGAPQVTNNPFDLMINGEGFFGVILPNNDLRFTRDGAFTVTAQGMLVTTQGYTLYPTILVPPGTLSVHITENGNVDAFISGQNEASNVGTIPVFVFTNPVGMQSIGKNLYRPTASSGEPVQQVAGQSGAGAISQGTLETSNVNIMTEMTELIRAQRAYEMNSKVMGVADQMLQTVNNIR